MHIGILKKTGFCVAFHSGSWIAQRQQIVHAAEAAQKQVVSEAPADCSESTAPTLPRLKKSDQVVPAQGTAAGKGTPSSSKKQAKEKGNKSSKAEETDEEDADERWKKRMRSK